MAVSVEEINEFKACIGPKGVEIANKEILQATIERTHYRKIRARLQFPELYPNEPLLVELSGDTMPPQVIKRMTRQADKLALELSQSGQVQVAAVSKLLTTAINENKLLFAFDEVKYIQSAMEGHGNVKMNEKKGSIKVEIQQEKYNFRVTFKLDDNYPASGVEVATGETNFHPNLVFIHISQAQELIRRCMLGYTLEQALAASNPIKRPPNLQKKAKGPKLTKQHLNNLKGDVKFLKQATDLRQVNTKKAAGRPGFANDTATRRAARRELKTLSKEELEKESKQAELDQAAQEAEAYAASFGGSSTPTKSLKGVFEFLKTNFVNRMISEPCLVCQKKILPRDPTKVDGMIKSKDLKRPERVLCGHWFHWGCLDLWMTTPPFGKTCPLCPDIPLYHPDWPADVKKLERAWANKQNKERELNEVADCFDLDDKFAR